nr:MAG TPA: hypothetical protein [Caudoviricetes sp.]
MTKPDTHFSLLFRVNLKPPLLRGIVTKVLGENGQ